ncbi:MAG: putative ATP-dependent transporter SufC [Alphaproteobacteria bacterium MarineAlpha9_Bin4]|nr:Fe-S cluster assembly ATPase SufC [Pelagibacterales bacterium]PPR26458.1 MAG: putative ATP-dependent transporter SufC [Alphaproteobacteria bacterium MarineAlpha9_Bin4]|tara:strand:- start:67 stop:804 length:738 start_codon:yes stop_codon:yes gene_type:complete
MLKISNLSVTVEDKLILDNLNLEIPKGKKVAIMGPNGSGKSTLSNVISGKFGYNIKKGNIEFEGKDILDCSADDRAAMGIYMAFQYPIEIPGIANSSFLRTAINSIRKKNNLEPVNTRSFLEEINNIANKLGLDKSFLSRDLNTGFSGGEKKKNEILQLLLIKPKFCVLDEIDSGLDIDALKVISKGISEFSSKTNSILIITHYQRLLDYIKPDEVHIFNDGKIIKSGNSDLVKVLEEKGYKEFC